MVDCDDRRARYVSASYFSLPTFVGEPVQVKHFEEGDVRPVTLPGAPAELAARMATLELDEALARIKPA